jgi:hypothetical protein
MEVSNLPPITCKAVLRLRLLCYDDFVKLTASATKGGGTKASSTTMLYYRGVWCLNKLLNTSTTATRSGENPYTTTAGLNIILYRAVNKNSRARQSKRLCKFTITPLATQTVKLHPTGHMPIITYVTIPKDAYYQNLQQHWALYRK